MTIGLIANNDGTGAVQLGGSNAISLDTSLNATMAGYVNAPNTFGFKNRIINGGMVIDQRNNGASVTPINADYTLDRWQFSTLVAGKATIQRSTTAPTGFSNSLLATSTSSYSIGSSEFVSFRQSIEGFNVADLAWGTASAATVTLSFWARSSLTGTFGGALANAANDRSYPFTYTINSANTWEQKSVTIAGDTTGTWLTTNGIGIIVRFSLGAGATYSGTAGAWAGAIYTSATGATSVVGTSGATLFITGVQLERGSIATSFDFRPYGTELALCMRYFQRMGGLVNNFGIQGYQLAGSGVSQTLSLPVQMRASPTAVLPTMSNINTSGLIVNQVSAECALILAAATANGSLSSLNSGAGFATFSIEL
jgi:hypothetical protein